MSNTNTAVATLADALRRSARNHHTVSRMLDKNSSHYSNRYWTKCVAISCRQAQHALESVGRKVSA